STRHNPEFTMLEYYTAHSNYIQAMDFLEQMLRFVAQQVCETLVLQFGDQTLQFAEPFKKISMYQAVIQYGSIAESDLQSDTIDATLVQHGLALDNAQAQWGHKLVALFEKLVE